jgi:hypothetical protein
MPVLFFSDFVMQIFGGGAPFLPRNAARTTREPLSGTEALTLEDLGMIANCVPSPLGIGFLRRLNVTFSLGPLGQMVFRRTGASAVKDVQRSLRGYQPPVDPTGPGFCGERSVTLGLPWLG